MRPKWYIVLALVTVLVVSTVVALGNKETAPGQEEDELIADEDLQDEDVSDQGENELRADEDLAAVDVFAAGGPIKCNTRCDNTQTCIEGTCVSKTSVCNGQVMVDGEVCCGKGKTKAPCDGECINGACCGDTADEDPCNDICCSDGFICAGTGCCKPSAEVCDGVDNDCDGVVDEGGDALCVCAEGTPVCLGADRCCCSTPEVCDEADNDCDGTIDEDCSSLMCDPACIGSDINCGYDLANCESETECTPTTCCPDARYGITSRGASCCAEGTNFDQIDGCVDLCENNIQDPEETGIDCGGSCLLCDGDTCSQHFDCKSRKCIDNVCTAPSCTDGMWNGDETGIDCGGSCPKCSEGQTCQIDTDCSSEVCGKQLGCVPATCGSGTSCGTGYKCCTGEYPFDCGDSVSSGFCAQECLGDGDCPSNTGPSAQMCGCAGDDTCLPEEKICYIS